MQARPVLVPLLTLVLLLALLAPGRAEVASAEIAALPHSVPGPIRAAVLRVIDGDTILVRADVWIGQVVETRVRVLGIDAPELHGRCTREIERAQAARAALKALAADSVLLSDVRPDKYGGRVLAHVETPDHVYVAYRMIDAGLARAYDGGRRRQWCP